jgi:hypothetical protein
VLHEGPSSTSGRASFAFRLVTGRYPSAAEIARIEQSLKRQLAHYRARPADARKVADDEESAAWTLVANALLNLDETVTK